jgi:hypothetical protein
MLDESQGIKFDDGKLQWDLLPWDGVAEIVKVLQFGAKKYAPHNWEKGIKFSRIFGAVIRHMTAWFLGETNDPETGLNHLAHAGCEILFALTYSVRGMKEFDDRPYMNRPNECIPCGWEEKNGVQSSGSTEAPGSKT